jgi:hypothetical protein
VQLLRRSQLGLDLGGKIVFSKLTLIDNWRNAWRWISVWALVTLSSLPVVWASLPEDLKVAVPDGWAKWIMFLVAIGGLAGRFVDQKGKDAPT